MKMPIFAIKIGDFMSNW